MYSIEKTAIQKTSKLCKNLTSCGVLFGRVSKEKAIKESRIKN